MYLYEKVSVFQKTNRIFSECMNKIAQVLRKLPRNSETNIGKSRKMLGRDFQRNQTLSEKYFRDCRQFSITSSGSRKRKSAQKIGYKNHGYNNIFVFFTIIF